MLGDESESGDQRPNHKISSQTFLIIKHNPSDKPFVHYNFHLNPMCHGCLPCLFCCILKHFFAGRVTLSQVVTSSREGKQTARET